MGASFDADGDVDAAAAAEELATPDVAPIASTASASAVTVARGVARLSRPFMLLLQSLENLVRRQVYGRWMSGR
jgi:hypothetical protein